MSTAPLYNTTLIVSCFPVSFFRLPIYHVQCSVVLLLIVSFLSVVLLLAVCCIALGMGVRDGMVTEGRCLSTSFLYHYVVKLLLLSPKTAFVHDKAVTRL